MGFNNQGKVVNVPAPNSGKASDANAEVTPTAAELSNLDALQMLLDIVGLIPGFGAPADVLNGIISAGRGDFVGAALSIFGVVPIAGEAATLAKIAKNSEKYLQALKVVESKVLPLLPAGARRKVQEALDAARKKLDDLLKKDKPDAPATKPKEEPATATDKDGKKVKVKPKPKCGQSGPYKDRNDHDNTGVNWDHVPSKAALLEAAKKAKGGPLTAKEITAISENAPTIAIPEKLHREQSETFGGRQNQTIDDEKRIKRDAGDLSRAAKENTDKLESKIDDYDPGCKGAYKKAAKKITKMTNDDWKKWLKQTMKDAK